MDKNQDCDDMYDDGDNFPKSFDWENMETEIMDKMRSLEKTAKPFLDRRYWIVISSLIGLLLFSCIWGCFIENMSSDVSSEVVAMGRLRKERNATIEQTLDLSDFCSDNQTIEDCFDVINQIAVSINKKARPSNLGTPIEKLSIPTTIINKTEDIRSTIEGSVRIASAEESVSYYMNTQYSNGHQENVNLVIDTKENLEGVYHTPVVKKIAYLNLLEPIDTLDLLLYIGGLNMDNEEEREKKKATSKWGLGLYVGMTDWKPNYKGNGLAMMKSDAERSITSYGIQTRLTYNLNRRWQIGSGLEFMQKESRFYFYGERDTTVIKNIVTSINVNAETGQILKENREDIYLNAVLWEKVVHYNKYQQLSIPLIVNRKWFLTNKMFVNTGIGIRYVFKTREIGKNIQSLDNNEGIFKVKDIKPEDYSYQNSLGLLANTSLNYQFSRRWHLGLSTEMNWSLTDVDTQYDTTLKPFGVFTSVLLQYRF